MLAGREKPPAARRAGKAAAGRKEYPVKNENAFFDAAAYRLLLAARRVCENAAAALDPDDPDAFRLHRLVMGRYEEAGRYAARLAERAAEAGHTIDR